MPIRKLRPFIKIFALLFVAITFSACQLIPGSQKTQSVTLKYWGLWESATSMNQIISDYKKIKPNVTILYDLKSPQQYRESLETQIQAGKATAPDIFRFHNTWVPMLKEELAPVPGSIYSQTDFKKTFYPTALADLKNPNKELVGIPLEIDGLELYYNVDILSAAGITAPPASWEEFSEDAIQLTVRDSTGSIRTAGAAMGTATNVDHFSDILGMMILQNNGDPKVPTAQKTKDAVEYYTNFAKGQNLVWDETMPASTPAFAGGTLAMYFAPSWRAIEIKNANPTLNFKVAPVPQLPDGKVAWASYWAEGVSAKSANQKEAWEFIKFIQEEQNLVKLYSEAAKSPGRIFGEPYPKVSMAAKLAQDPIVGAYIADAPFMRSFPMASQTFDNGLNDQVIKAYEDAINTIHSGSDITNALETAGQNINTIFAKFSAPTATKK